MGVLNVSGSLPVAVVLQWKGDIVKNAASFRGIPAVQKELHNHVYVIANELLTKFRISVFDPGPPGATLAPIEREAVTGSRFYDDVLNTYTTAPVPVDTLEKVLTLGKSAPCTISMTITFDEIFNHLALQMTRTDGVLRNLANPSQAESQLILATFSRRAGKKVSFDYTTRTLLIASIPCTLVDHEVKHTPGNPPGVKLVFELDLMKDGSVQRDVMLGLTAADWSQIARAKAPTTSPMTARQLLWWKNVHRYLVNHTDMKRAERLRSEIVQRHVSKDPATLAIDLRADIDRHLITANHWGDAREDMKTETHQRLLSDLFGTLHQEAWDASPVRFLRATKAALDFKDNDEAALALQYGVGHCGEHATVSFSTLCDIATQGQKVSRVIRSGNANIDHDFVVYELDPPEVTETLTTNPNNSRPERKDKKDNGANKPMQVWNLRETIAKNARIGFVLDPYLDKTVMKSKASELLQALNKKARVDAGLDTDFLAFEGIFPSQPAFTKRDLRTAKFAERQRLVKHV